MALGIEVEDRPFAKSTLQLFQARLILHEMAREVFERSLRFARETGYLKSRRMKVALDTTYILGRGAVKDTYNLLSDGVVELMRALSELERSDLVEWAAANGYQRYVGSSVKGDACIDWDDKAARTAPAKWPAKISLVLLAMITDGSYSTRSRFMGGLRASMYFFAVSQWMPSSRATPRIDNPPALRLLNSVHLAV